MKKLSHNLREQYKGVLDSWNSYWSCYGGTVGVISSPYFHLSIIITAFSYNTWSHPNWWDSVISTIPTIIGFTLAGLAVLLCMDSDFCKLISGDEDDGEKSPFVQLVAQFVHFIVMQAIALLFALCASSLYFALPFTIPLYSELLKYTRPALWAICYLSFIYSLTLIIAAAFSIFRVAGWFDDHLSNQPDQDDDS